VADQHGLRQYIRTSHKVTHAQWIEDREVWRVSITKTDGRDLVISSPGVTEGETEDAFESECDVLVNCSGFFNNWKWPNVGDRAVFKGKLLHTAAWPQDAEDGLDGQTVALIGNGSSGVQVLPAIIDRVKKVYVHMRSPTWVTTNFAAKYAGPGGMNYDYTEEQKAAWAANPALYLEYRRQIEKELNSRFALYVDHTPEQKAAREFGVREMTTKLRAGGKEELLQALLPDFAVGYVVRSALY
jgi:cation diffusion facilitator CzcD-associated flavoprotein CzcO